MIKDFKSSEHHRHVSKHDRRWLPKLNLHVLILIFSIVSASLFSAAIPQWNANFYHTSGPIRWDWTDAISIAPLTISMAYSATYLVRNFKATKKVAAPRLHLVMTGLVLTSLLPGLIVAGMGSLFRFWRPAVRSATNMTKCNVLNMFSKECQPTLYSVGELQLGAIVFGSFVWFLTFILFAFACRDLRHGRISHRRELEKSQRRRQRRHDRHARHDHEHRERNRFRVPVCYVRQPESAYTPGGHPYSQI